MTVAAQFTDTATLGALVVGALVSIAGLVAIVAGVRWRVSAEVSSATADELRKARADDKEIAADREARRTEELREALTREERTSEALRAAQQTIARLESLPDLARVVQLLDAHEVRAQERHESVVEVLHALTDRLTNETVGGTR